MAFGIMNTRRYVLVYATLAALFINCCSLYWTMWSVLTMSLFMLLITDFMFFEVCHASCAHLPSASCGRHRTLTRPRPLL